MESEIARAIRLKHGPVALVWTDEKPEGAIQFERGKWGCVMFLFVTALKGKTAVFDRETFGCWGGGVGLGLGNQYPGFPGGLEGFCRFLSDGNGGTEQGRRIGHAMAAGGARADFVGHFLHGERFRKSPELVKAFLDDLPIVDIPDRYVVFKPLAAVDPQKEKPASVVFLVDPDQLSALVVMAGYDRPGCDNVFTPQAAACQMIGILTYREAASERPRGIVGLTDVAARKYVRNQVGKDMLTFSVPFKRFLEMEAGVAGSFLEGETWRSLAEGKE